jgi:hypothetical protein
MKAADGFMLAVFLFAVAIAIIDQDWEVLFWIVTATMWWGMSIWERNA